MELFKRYPIARRLPLTADVDALRAELLHIPEAWWGTHLGPYHDGAWESIALWAPGGDRRNQTSRGGAFASTAALDQSPAMRAVIEQLPGEKNRVRLMRLRPGGRILRHYDPMEDIDPRLVRLHMPIVTNEQVRFLVNDTRVVMTPGELWHIDVRFPHEVHNAGATERVHLVADLVRCPELDAFLGGGESIGEGFLTTYFAKHMIPRRVRMRLGLGN